MEVLDLRSLFSSPKLATRFILLLSIIAIPVAVFMGIFLINILISLFPAPAGLEAHPIFDRLSGIIVFLVLISLIILPFTGGFLSLDISDLWIKIFVLVYFFVQAIFITFHIKIGITLGIVTGWLFLCFFSLHGRIFRSLLRNPESITTRHIVSKVLLSIACWALCGFTIMSIASAT